MTWENNQQCLNTHTHTHTHTHRGTLAIKVGYN